jgi:N-acetylmuramoyl-L-alanine amidase
VVDGRRILGTTTSAGIVEQKVSAGARGGELTVWLAKGKREGAHHAWTLKIGHLDPADTLEGVQARLNNLGYAAGSVNGALEAQTRGALAAFQAAKKLPMTGALDDATGVALEQHHEGA